MNPPKKRFWLLSLVLVVALVAAACGDDDDDTGTETTAAGDGDTTGTTAAGDGGGELAGEFLVSGSSTVFPIVNLQAERFGAENPSVAIAVEGPGTGDGAVKFCDGDVPIANASRLYKDDEGEEIGPGGPCEENGVDFIELRRAIDGISIITSAQNDAIECLSFDELYALTSEEATGFASWADANDLLAEMGSTAGELPDAPLDIYGPGEESGTFDTYVSFVIEGVAEGETGLDVEAREFAENSRPDYNSSPDDNTIIAGVAGSQYSLGWVGYEYAVQAEEAGEVKILDVSVEAGGDCVTPTVDSIQTFEYPIARYVYTYVNPAMAEEEPAVAAFVDYMLSDEGLAAVAEAGLVDLTAEDIATSQEIWDNRTTGRQWE